MADIPDPPGQEASAVSGGCTKITIVPDGNLILSVDRSLCDRWQDWKYDSCLRSSQCTNADSCPGNRYHFQVASEHLCFVSKAFRVFMTVGGKAHTALATTGSAELNLENDDPEALGIVLLTIFGRSRLVKDEPDMMVLASVCRLVDIYELHEVMDPFIRKWYEGLFRNSKSAHYPLWSDIKFLEAAKRDSLPSSDICGILISVTHVLGDGYIEAMEGLLYLAQMETTLNFDHLELPMPQSKIEELVKKRETCFKDMAKMIADQKEQWLEQSELPLMHSDCCDILVGNIYRLRKHSDKVFSDPENLVLHPYATLQDAVDCVTSWKLSIDCRLEGVYEEPFASRDHGQDLHNKVKEVMKKSVPAHTKQASKKRKASESEEKIHALRRRLGLSD